MDSPGWDRYVPPGPLHSKRGWSARSLRRAHVGTYRDVEVDRGHPLSRLVRPVQVLEQAVIRKWCRISAAPKAILGAESTSLHPAEISQHRPDQA